MAQQIYPMNMQDTIYPLVSQQQTRTIIGASVGQAPADAVRPGVAYMHNVMPTKYGMNSVGYTEITPAITDPTGLLRMVDVRVVQSTTGVRQYLGFLSNGAVYLLDYAQNEWNDIASDWTLTDIKSDKITSANVNGVTYIYYANTGLFKLRGANPSVATHLETTAVTGLSTSDVIGVVASSGYLIAYTKTAVAWSSTIDPTDFVPSQVTGSGGGNIAEADGAILFVTSNSLGILIYTFNNVIAGTYTGNALYPFKFREVDNSKGGLNLGTVAWEANSVNQFVYSKAGLMSVTSQKADAFLPEITDFIAGKLFEDFNEITKLLEVTTIPENQQLAKKITFIASRYLIVSYGLITAIPQVFTHAIVVDTVMQKVGKLRIDHMDVFEYIATPAAFIANLINAKSTVGFVSQQGLTNTVNFSSTAPNTGVLIMGKLQATLTRFLGLLGVEVENVRPGATLDLLSSASLDGKNFTNVAGTLKDSLGNLREYSFRSSALTHNIIMIGDFNLVNLQIAYRVEGKR